jgi:hypothetical protein
MARLDEVFVPGRLPGATYVPRARPRLEEALRAAIDGRGRIVWLTGPPKSGKTVLVRKAVPDAVELPVGDVRAGETFWSEVVDRFRRPGPAPADPRPPRVEARELLRDHLGEVLFVDDFHCVPADAQLEIVRGLKPLVFDGLRVVVASTAQRAPALRRELAGRAARLELPLWRRDELAEIAERGFAALNATAGPRDVDRLAFEALASPYRMQELCLRLCRRNGVLETAAETVVLDLGEREGGAPAPDNVRPLRSPAAATGPLERRALRRLG